MFSNLSNLRKYKSIEFTIPVIIYCTQEYLNKHIYISIRVNDTLHKDTNQNSPFNGGNAMNIYTYISFLYLKDIISIIKDLTKKFKILKM